MEISKVKRCRRFSARNNSVIMSCNSFFHLLTNSSLTFSCFFVVGWIQFFVCVCVYIYVLHNNGIVCKESLVLCGPPHLQASDRRRACGQSSRYPFSYSFFFFLGFLFYVPFSFHNSLSSQTHTQSVPLISILNEWNENQNKTKKILIMNDVFKFLICV